MIKPVTVKAVSTPLLKKNRKTDDKKIKVLWYSDFLCHTGFGNVASEMMKQLLSTGKYEFEVVGINYHGKPYNIKGGDYEEFKDVPVWSAQHSRGGDSVLGLNILSELITESEFDILFILQDSFNLIPLRGVIEAARRKKNFKYILYFPVDGGLKPTWIEEAAKVADFPVVYTNYGKKELQKISSSLSTRVLYHGINQEIFFPFKTDKERDDFRKSYFDLSPTDFLITNVNRNQIRKDFPRSLLAFAEFCKRYPEVNAYFYLHCIINDSAGVDLSEFCRTYLPPDVIKRLKYPNMDIMRDTGYPIEILNSFYGASDLVTSTTLGEGFGLSTIEAMACKTPVVMPNNSATTEIIGENEERGYLVKSGGDINLYTTLKGDNTLSRPLTDINDLVEKWKHVYDNREEAKSKAETAYLWLKDYTWEKVGKQWDEIFEKAYNSI